MGDPGRVDMLSLGQHTVWWVPLTCSGGRCSVWRSKHCHLFVKRQGVAPVDCCAHLMSHSGVRPHDTQHTNTSGRYVCRLLLQQPLLTTHTLCAETLRGVAQAPLVRTASIRKGEVDWGR